MSEKSEVRVERGPVAQDEPFALGMAKLLEREGKTVAAAELRRLSIENERIGPLAERVLELKAQRDALLKMLKDVLPIAEDASESLGRFCSDEGWAQEDMDRMDNVDGMLPLIRAAIKAVEEGK